MQPDTEVHSDLPEGAIVFYDTTLDDKQVSAAANPEAPPVAAFIPQPSASAPEQTAPEQTAPTDPPKKYVVEAILKHRKRGTGFQFLVKWEGFAESENSWEPRKNLAKVPVFQAYEATATEAGVERAPKPKRKSKPVVAPLSTAAAEASGLHASAHHDASPLACKRHPFHPNDATTELVVRRLGRVRGSTRVGFPSRVPTDRNKTWPPRPFGSLKGGFVALT
jgi:hypothetical protein